MATGARASPMFMITGPTTTDGRIRSMNPMPRHRIKAAMPMCTNPAANRPPRATGMPHWSRAATIGAMNANELARNTGTLRPVMK